MISLLQKKSLKIFHPILRRLVKIYLKKPRGYQYNGIKIDVLPGVFHPGLFFSTGVFLEFVGGLDLEGKRVLELGAGSGLLSIFCALRKRAEATASDINPIAIKGLEANAEKNKVAITIKESDLFDQLNPGDFDFILINPPYYPKNPTNIEEKAWFCGEEFDYFKKLFQQLKVSNLDQQEVYMILSEDCQVATIDMLAGGKGLSLNVVYEKVVSSEINYIFRIDSRQAS